MSGGAKDGRVAATFDDDIAACLRETACARGAPDDARWLRALKSRRGCPYGSAGSG